MPPKRTIHVDPDAVLLAVYRAVQEDFERLTAQWDAINFRTLRHTREENRYVGRLQIDIRSAEAGWTKYDVPRLAGGIDLSESEKQAWRRVLRNDLMKRELIDIFQRRIWISPAGREAAKGLIDGE